MKNPIKKPKTPHPSVTGPRARAQGQHVPKSEKEGLITAILGEISTSTLGLRKICSRPGYPTAKVFWAWLDADPSVRTRYEAAKRAQAELLTEEMQEIADDRDNDVIPDGKGGVMQNHVAVARAKLRVDTRKVLAEKLAPKRFGNNAHIELEATHQFASVVELRERLANVRPLLEGGGLGLPGGVVQELPAASTE